ncbi:hypothetical protein AB0M47_35150 [Hamadaea sp. NPDC051192]|uniref:hypothetical protein n=1 Tax=Hamadaea sp. NPDC051192 TaxID=3154940 RepID=UPI003444D0F4
MTRTPSDADLRAVLIALIRRAGGEVEISNAELYDAMLPDLGMRAGGFAVEEIADGIRLVLTDEHP